MNWSTFLRTGHREHCPAHQRGSCQCEGFLYTITGVLSLCTGLIQIGYGYTRSLAVASDALHALIDSSVDFYGGIVARQSRVSPETAEVNARRFSVIAGILLIGGVLFLWWELAERIIAGYREVSATAVCILGGLGSGIDGLRLWLLSQAERRSSSPLRPGVVAHVKNDLWHSLFVLSIGIFLLFALALDQRFSRFLPSFDIAGTVLIGIIMLFYARNLISRPESGHHHDQDGHHHHDHG